MDLVSVFGEELAKQIQEKLGDKKIILDDGLMIPKHRFDEETEKNKQLKSQVETYDKQLKDLKKSAEGNEDLTRQIETLQKQNKEIKEGFDKELIKVKKTNALEKLLKDAKHPDLLLSKFELDKIELDGEKIKDADNVLKPVKEQYPDMFGTVKKQGFDPNKDANNPQPGAITKEVYEANKNNPKWLEANLPAIKEALKNNQI